MNNAYLFFNIGTYGFAFCVFMSTILGRRGYLFVLVSSVFALLMLISGTFIISVNLIGK